MWSNLLPDQIIGTAAIIKEIDCLTATVADIKEVRSEFSLSITSQDRIELCGFGGWFDVHFRVSYSGFSFNGKISLKYNVSNCFLFHSQGKN